MATSHGLVMCWRTGTGRRSFRTVACRSIERPPAALSSIDLGQAAGKNAQKQNRVLLVLRISDAMKFPGPRVFQLRGLVWDLNWAGQCPLPIYTEGILQRHMCKRKPSQFSRKRLVLALLEPCSRVEQA